MRLRHFLLCLRQKELSLSVGNLVKCRTQDELDSLKALYEEEFRAGMNEKRYALLTRNLKNVGLADLDEKHVIRDERGWNALSM
jgi:hypothetical protein